MLPLQPLYLIDLAGVAVFAVSGALAAGRKQLDLFGVLVIATVTAIGGGTLRDVLIDRPIFWMANTVYLWVILGAAGFTVIYSRFGQPPRRALLVADALGLALFAISGAQIAEQAGQSGIVAVILGTMSATAGGVVRDILTAEIPLILRSGDIYATAAVVGIAVYLMLQVLGEDQQSAAFVGMVLVVGIRFAAIFLGWRMPRFRLREGQRDD
jgi:uncharacterized membrane protein YeiH